MLMRRIPIVMLNHSRSHCVLFRGVWAAIPAPVSVNGGGPRWPLFQARGRPHVFTTTNQRAGQNLNETAADSGET